MAAADLISRAGTGTGAEGYPMAHAVESGGLIAAARLVTALVWPV